MPAYDALLARYQSATQALQGTLKILDDFEGCPFTWIRLGGPDGLKLLIDAGIHGEEPASTLGLAAWLEHDAAPWMKHLNITILPCLNPHGFEHGTRGSRDTPDLNRQFDQPDAPPTRLVARALAAERFALALDLHEDCDFAGFYLYELKFAPPYLGERVVQAASTLSPLSHHEPVGTFRTEHGLIRPERSRASMRAREGWPIAFHHFEHVTDHVITVETPGRQPLATRTALQRVCLNEACAFLLAPTSGPRLATNVP